MKIHFERSGGFSGISMKTSIDVDSLPAGESEALKMLVDGAAIEHFVPSADAGKASDQFSYSITIETEEQKKSIVLSEQQIPPQIEPLVRYLVGKVRGRG